MSSGGLSMSFSWIDQPGFFIPTKDRPIADKLYLDHDIAEQHYIGFSNSILWPLFDYHPGEMNLDGKNWLANRIANTRFAEVIRQQIRENSMVWVQEYHLMFLPSLFLSLIPGPEFAHGIESEDYLLEGRVLSTTFFSACSTRSDLIGLYTCDYARHFLSSCTHILSLPTMPNGLAHVGTFRIGIDPRSFIKNLEKESVQKRITALEQRFNGVKVIVGIDRLDYVKDVPQKLPQHCTHVEEYQNLRATSMPVHFMHKGLHLDELCAWYALSDVFLVIGTRDGIDSVSNEHVSCRQTHQGVIILSEFAGTAESLNGSIVINPWHSQQVAHAIHEAVTIPAGTRADNHRKLFKYVTEYSAAIWARLS
ncbi:hypothetical protein EI94DRAFT_1773992 [Lactarius quietus]|nr:hypothetical protein EI94DRAFT_1773992 [Lactarius quietus]